MTFQRYPTSTIILCKSEKLWFKIGKIGTIFHTRRKRNYFTDQLLNWDLFENLFYVKQRREKDDKREKSNKK